MIHAIIILLVFLNWSRHSHNNAKQAGPVKRETFTIEGYRDLANGSSSKSSNSEVNIQVCVKKTSIMVP